MATGALAEEFRREADTESNQSLGSRLVSGAVLLEHIAQTQEVLRVTCLDLSDVLLGMADDPKLRSRFTVIRGAFSRSSFVPTPPAGPAQHGTTEASVPYAVTD